VYVLFKLVGDKHLLGSNRRMLPPTEMAAYHQQNFRLNNDDRRSGIWEASSNFNKVPYLIGDKIYSFFKEN